MTQKPKSIGKQRRESIMALLAGLVIEHQHIRKRPNTSIELRLDRPGAPSLFGQGFSKVRYPDVWDPKYGYELAFQKALADIARQLIAEGETIAALEDCLRRFPEISGLPFAPDHQRVAVLILDVPEMSDMGKGC